MLRLRRDVVRAVRGGHPWIYAEALVPPPDVLPPGAVVDVADFAGRFLARGLWNPDSPIAVRVFTLDPKQSVDADLVKTRFLAAAARRESILSEATDCCRLVHGEADGLPGIVCDRYGHVAVVRFDDEAAASLRAAATEAAAGLPGIREVVERPFERKGRGDRSGGPPATEPRASARGRAPLGSRPPGRGSETEGSLDREEPRSVPLVVRENGLAFEVDTRKGHKTGLYLDQRDNRALVRSLAAGRRTLDLFSYVGAFTVAAAAGEAGPSLSIDVSRPALAAARRNLALNDLPPDDRDFLAADVFEWLESPDSRRRSWDLIVLDPPSLAPNHSAVKSAVAAYRRLNAAALRLAAPRALVLSCSCSSHVRERLFRETVLAAAGDARRKVDVLESRGAAPDHPLHPRFPEGAYLKALLLRL